MPRRSEQVSELLRAELSRLLQNDVRDPRVSGLVSVTRVDVSPDLARANAFVSIFSSEHEQTATLAALDSARPFLRRELAKRLQLRKTPDVEFVLDDSIQRGQHLTDIMRENAAERGESI